MYTLTRKLAVVCLTLVLSVLVYGCGGSSKQTLITTPVSTDMVTAGLTPDSGTYPIRPGGTANAGDVRFECDEEESSCEVTVPDDGPVTSTGGMATAMDSASATARLAAEEAARLARIAQEAAEGERDAAELAQQMAEDAQQMAEDARGAAELAQAGAEDERDAAELAQQMAEQAQADAEQAQQMAEQAQADAEQAQQMAEQAQADAELAQQMAEQAQADAELAQTGAEDERDDAVLAQQMAEGLRDDAVLAQQMAEGLRNDALLAQKTAEEERDDANKALMIAVGLRDDALLAQKMAEGLRDDAVLAQTGAEDERDAALLAQKTAEEERDDANKALMIAVAMRDEALAALTIANRRANAKSVDLSDLDSNYMTITPGIYTIKPGDNMDVGDANFACPADDGLACEVIVAADEDGDTTVVSGDGVATAQHSVAAMNTMTAIELTELTSTSGATPGALVMQEPETTTDSPTTGSPVTVAVSRSPSGVTTIELTHVAGTEEVEYAKAVDTGHEIAGWMSQTLKRDDSEAADTDADTDAVPADEMDEATFYTNIDPAKPGKLKDVSTVDLAEIAVDADLVLVGLTDEDDTFRAEIIRTDGTRIPGTFTCDADSCAPVATDDLLVLGVTVLSDEILVKDGNLNPTIM